MNERAHINIFNARLNNVTIVISPVRLEIGLKSIICIIRYIILVKIP